MSLGVCMGLFACVAGARVYIRRLGENCECRLSLAETLKRNVIENEFLRGQ